MTDPDLPAGVERREFDGETRLATRGPPVYGEPTADGWRAWDPERSKLGGMLELGFDTGLTGGETVLYLGAASGTTVSHVADFAGPTYAVEFAPRPARDLVDAAEPRDRLFPLLKDARTPARYAHVVESDVDAVVQDVATRGQAEVAVRNARFLADDGRLLLAIKARSEDVTAAPESVFESALDRLRGTYEILETQRLDRFHEDHLGVVATPQDGSE
ncbi:fibrillarin-like rRNA/tRNA 2'-O-methyltransferase [Halorubrum halophilum]|uniref:fibrillarin-like rRNA/tRNA 2'-O-methyltransferase n=1 Tax=Halorubrum halophilum TaxID=413816 RepID=UPI00186B53D0|nr:fibrillarin-like rRNA/tRNA 2'-O-methyltransferase [Halorubrum halophilum]